MLSAKKRDDSNPFPRRFQFYCPYCSRTIQANCQSDYDLMKNNDVFYARITCGRCGRELRTGAWRVEE